MGKALKRWIVPSMAVLLAAVPAGCESVGGLDLNKVLVDKAAESVSVEPERVTSATIGFELDWNEELLEADLQEAELEGEDEAYIARQKKLLDWLTSVSFKLNEIRTDENGRVLASGALTFGKGDIPFRLHVDESSLLLEVEGAKRPLVIDIGGVLPIDGGLAGGSPWFGLQNTEEGEALVRTVASYFIGHLPNPPSIEAKLSSVDIHGTKTNVTHVHAELNGKQLGELIPAYLDALSKDEEGLRKMLNDVTQWIEDLPQELKTVLEVDDETLPAKEEIEETVREALDAFKQLREEFDASKEEAGEEWNEAFNENTTLLTDLYVDSGLNIRKLAAELKVDLPEMEEDYAFIPLEGFTLRFEQENWLEENAEPIPNVAKPLRALGLEDMESLSTIGGLRLFENDSLIYDLLKNDFEIDDTSFILYPREVWAWEAPYYVAESGEILLPVRQTLEGFEDNVVYQGGKLSFYDEATYQEAALTVGSDKIKVNGAEQTWNHPVVAIDGVAYAYADDLLDLLGAGYSLVPGDENGGLLIERDL
ncbi:hypothetical protein [Cohnella thailandensis]|uniref:Copper amine oxidase-like N-terminal domain-containing protein n=1 Tax=Cohnella thailandensis TaxID=557557 RepID=A0A841SS27_9BACL|nr:hypothetical protein [Cohnella thailandensis]MBB6632710.1 hypothetical protein [Cohnella thailandensis]MBP1975601.1 hypothetical protein [Cohnella thailandensis]